MYEAELALAREAAEAGGALALDLYGRAAARRKPDGSWVTEADDAVEAEVRRRIAAAFPAHNVLGEEEGLRAADGGAPRAGAPTWVVDPIDATANYVTGIPIWGVLVGLQVAGESVVGVVQAPALGETYEAARGIGASFNGRSMRVDPVSELRDAQVIFADVDSFVAAVLNRCSRSRGLGDFWGHLLVARGAAHAMIESARLALWDVVALEPILAEAGAVFTDFAGEPWAEGRASMTSCGPELHDELVELHRAYTRAA